MADGVIVLNLGTGGNSVSTYHYTRTSDSAVVDVQKFAIINPNDPLEAAAPVKATAPLPTDNALITRGLVHMEDFTVALKQMLNAIRAPEYIEPATGRVRITLDAIAGSLTLATISSVSNVGSVTALQQLGSQDIKQTHIFPLDAIVWADVVRGRIT
jgi:hypothetical protein